MIGTVDRPQWQRSQIVRTPTGDAGIERKGASGEINRRAKTDSMQKRLEIPGDTLLSGADVLLPGQDAARCNHQQSKQCQHVSLTDLPHPVKSCPSHPKKACPHLSLANSSPQPPIIAERACHPVSAL